MNCESSISQISRWPFQWITGPSLYTILATRLVISKMSTIVNWKAVTPSKFAALTWLGHSSLGRQPVTEGVVQQMEGAVITQADASSHG